MTDHRERTKTGDVVNASIAWTRAANGDFWIMWVTQRGNARAENHVRAFATDGLALEAVMGLNKGIEPTNGAVIL